MTPLETLAKYGLKSDVKSIKERIEKDSYFQDLIGVLHIPHNEMLCDVGWGKLNNARSICRTADLSLLCSLAEKGERYEKAVTILKNRRNKLRGESANGFQSKLNEFTVDTLDYLLMKITEAEGE